MKKKYNEIYDQIYEAKTVNQVKLLLDQLLRIDSEKLNNLSHPLNAVAANSKIYSHNSNTKQTMLNKISNSVSNFLINNAFIKPHIDPFVELVRYFVNQGGKNSNISSDNLVSLALFHYKYAMAEELVEQGFKFKHVAVREALKKPGISKKLINLMIEKAGLPDKEVMNRENWARFAALNGNGDLVLDWLKKGLLHVNEVMPPLEYFNHNDKGAPIIHYVIDGLINKENFELLKYLIQNGADLDSTPEKYEFESDWTKAKMAKYRIVSRIEDGKKGAELLDEMIKYSKLNINEYSYNGGSFLFSIIPDPSWIPELVKRNVILKIEDILSILSKMYNKSSNRIEKSLKYDVWFNALKDLLKDNQNLLSIAENRKILIESARKFNYYDLVEHIDSNYPVKSPIEAIKNLKLYATDGVYTDEAFKRLKSLIEKTSDNELSNLIEKNTVLHLLANISILIGWDNKEGDRITYLIKNIIKKNKIDLNAVNEYGKTAMELAINQKNTPLIEFFINSNANVRIETIYEALNHLDPKNNIINQLIVHLNSNLDKFSTFGDLVALSESKNRPDIIITILKKYPNLINHKMFNNTPLAFYLLSINRFSINVEFTKSIIEHLIDSNVSTEFTDERGKNLNLLSEIKYFNKFQLSTTTKNKLVQMQNRESESGGKGINPSVGSPTNLNVESNLSCKNIFKL